MRKRILKKIQKAQASSICGMEIQRQPRRIRTDFIRTIERDSNGNTLDSDGNIVLTRIKTKDKPLSPAEQFQLSEFGPKGRALRELRKQRQDGSEVGLDKKFEKDLFSI